MIEIKHLSVNQWLRSAIPDSQQPSSPIGFLFLKLPPPPCAVLLVRIIEGSLEVKLPTIWTNEKQRWEESEKRREEERRSKKRKSQKKEDPGARKSAKVAKHSVFLMIYGSGGSKSRIACRGGAKHICK